MAARRPTAAERRARADAKFDAALTADGWAAKHGSPAEAEDMRRGLHICLVVTPAYLGDVADDLRCAVLALVEHYPELERVDLGALQDVAKLLRSAGRP